jgi:hypothetical protein
MLNGVDALAASIAAGELGKARGTPVPHPVKERIYCKREHETCIDVAGQTDPACNPRRPPARR